MDIVPQLIVNSVIAASLYALIAMGFNLIFGASRFVNIAHGSMAAVGAYTAFALGISLHMPLAVAMAGGVIAAALLGYVSERLIFRPLRKRKSSGLVLLVASLGAFTAVESLIAILFTSQFKTLSSLAGMPGALHLGT